MIVMLGRNGSVPLRDRAVGRLFRPQSLRQALPSPDGDHPERGALEPALTPSREGDVSAQGSYAAPKCAAVQETAAQWDLQ